MDFFLKKNAFVKIHFMMCRVQNSNKKIHISVSQLWVGGGVQRLGECPNFCRSLKNYVFTNKRSTCLRLEIHNGQISLSFNTQLNPTKEWSRENSDRARQEKKDWWKTGKSRGSILSPFWDLRKYHVESFIALRERPYVVFTHLWCDFLKWL